MLVSAVQQRDSAICIHTSPPSWASSLHPTPLGHHRAPIWAPCVIQQLPTSCLFTHDSAYVNATLPVCLTLPFPPLRPRDRSQHLHLYLCPANWIVPVMWSKVSQKIKYCILMHIYESRKMELINLFAEPFLYKRSIRIQFEILPKVRKDFWTYWKVSPLLISLLLKLYGDCLLWFQISFSGFA